MIQRRYSYSGFSLVETLIAAALLFLGLAGMAPLIAVSFTVTHQSVVQTETHYRLKNLLHETHLAVIASTDCRLASTSGSDSVNLRGRTLRLYWSVEEPTIEEFLPRHELRLLTVWAVSEPTGRVVDFLSALQPCRDN